MKIAILAPSPVPFEVGGAEKLWWGLQNHINKHTSHQCELLKFPTREEGFWEIIDSYKFYSELDLSYFDMLISTKYPCWMTPHHNHHLYMMHCLRGLYDTYHFANLPEHVAANHPAILALLAMMENCTTPLSHFFNALYRLKNIDGIAPETFSFPGPFIRKIVHFLDKFAMRNIQRFLAISKTVSKRLEYFPTGTEVQVVYPPSNLTNFHNQSSSYFFSVSRLDGPKRIRLIIEAYLLTKTDIPLKIAGTGPLEQELKELAKDDNRIEFLGFVSDEQLTDYYANAYAVIFVPYDEDYGLITIEAMMSSKPVLTFSDSGGVSEFVKDGKTGLVSKPSVEDLAANIDLISQDRNLAAKLGSEAAKQVNFITWDYCSTILLQKNTPPTNRPIKKITVVSTYPVYPPRGGGQNRIFYLYKELARSLKVEIIALAHEDDLPTTREIAPNLWEIRIPKSKEHARKEWQIGEKVGIPVTDIAMLYLYEETADFVEAVKKSVSDADYVVSSQPYSYPLIKSIANIPIIYDSHNLEYLLKKQMLPNNSSAQKFLKKLFDAEKSACLESQMTTVCAMADGQAMTELYNLDPARLVEVPNGVDPASVSFTSPSERQELKKRMGLAGIKIALFIGSWHQPNLDAINYIFKMAEKLPHIKFIVLGSAGAFFEDKKTPENLGFMGVVEDTEKALMLSIADVGLNPMQVGSGTNLKMLDYMLAGVPVISTKIGARGLNLPKGAIVECEVSDFCNFIEPIHEITDTTLAYEHVRANLTWEVVCDQLQKSLTEKIDALNKGPNST